MGPLSFRMTVARLAELVETEHGDCGQNTCDISVALRHGFNLWAIYLFAQTGAASDEFGALYDSLDRRRFKPRAELQRKAFVESVDHMSCPHCNAIIWAPAEVTNGGLIYCDNCAKRTPVDETKGA